MELIFYGWNDVKKLMPAYSSTMVKLLHYNVKVSENPLYYLLIRRGYGGPALGTAYYYYWVASSSAEVNLCNKALNFGLYSVRDDLLAENTLVNVGNGVFSEEKYSNCLRPVVVLKPNVIFTEKNASGVWNIQAK